MSDVVTDEMISALSRFQGSVGLANSGGSVTPGDDTIAAIQKTHFDTLIAAVDVSELHLADAGSFIAQETD